MDLSMREESPEKLLITGGAGFIGSTVIRNIIGSTNTGIHAGSIR